ncbi:hypothetical protein F4802DRAFT_594345 [Xylaria palmicola]|nr:hypothetical protein F4802DRAFT_594345 [Xylaria palmicola]
MRAGKVHFSSTSHRAASGGAPVAPGLLRRLASTPRGRASLAAVAIVGCVVDYELWALYGAKYFGKADDSFINPLSSLLLWRITPLKFLVPQESQVRSSE